MSTVNHQMLAAFALMNATKTTKHPAGQCRLAVHFLVSQATAKKGLSPLALSACVCVPPTVPHSSRGQTLNTSHTSMNKYCLLLLFFGHNSSKCAGAQRTKSNNTTTSASVRNMANKQKLAELH